MKPTIQSHLKFLYGPRQAAQTEIELAALAGQCRERLSRQGHAGDGLLTEKDALLITYADQVLEPNRAPLQT